jgi:hypothetical protein
MVEFERVRSEPDTDLWAAPVAEPTDDTPVDRWTWERAVREQARAAGMPPTSQHIGLLLATYTDATTGGEAFPPIATLVRTSGRGKDTVHRALRWLRENGWLKQVQRGSKGLGRASEYQLTLPTGLI